MRDAALGLLEGALLLLLLLWPPSCLVLQFIGSASSLACNAIDKLNVSMSMLHDSARLFCRYFGYLISTVVVDSASPLIY